MPGPDLPVSPRERLILALDLPSGEEAVTLARKLSGEVLWVKVGLELFCRGGPRVVEELASLGKRIFLDLKFHDIPNTVARAVAAAARLPVQLIDIHAAAGMRALEAAHKASSGRSDLGLLAVTRLTSEEADEGGFDDVARLAEMASRAGLFGVVCPAAAASRLRACHGDSLARVCPGIRPRGSDAHDQVHVATPEGAVASGAHWIVVGRAVTQAPDPIRAVREILAGMAGAGA